MKKALPQEDHDKYLEREVIKEFMKSSQSEWERRRHKDYTEWKDSTDKIERLVYFINYLSPHNIWKGAEAIEELLTETIDQAVTQALERVEKEVIGKREIINETGNLSTEGKAKHYRNSLRSQQRAALEKMREGGE